MKNTGHICKYKLPEDVAFVLMKNARDDLDEYDDDSYLTYDNYGFEHRIIYVHLKKLLYPSSQYPSFQYQASKIGYCMLDMGDGINRRITVKMIKDWFIGL